ncbi:MAG: PPOX class F420-dependent oxidoreductase [Candidatus Promineifilaceae bacterium]|jgi:PPOX class probable F420-dependent enzyme
MESIPESHRELLAGPYFAALTTIAPDGIPENTIVWCSLEGDTILINTTDDRRKYKNIKENPNVAVLVLDPEDGYNWIDVRGRVEKITGDPDFANIDRHTKIYTGKDSFYGDIMPAEAAGTHKRVVLHIKPERVVVSP